MSPEKIISDIKNKKFKPIYFLHGEETFFIDQIVDYMEANLLTEDEKSFNQTVVYGNDTKYVQLKDVLLRYPMMSSFQVVILKEAQQMKELNLLENYVKSPSPTTIFVICYKYGKVKKNTTFGKVVSGSKDVLLFESEPIKDYKVAQWIESYVASQGMSIDPRSSAFLFENLGNDLGKIARSLEKLCISLEGRKVIKTEDIEKYVGISKDYNVFELNNSLLSRDIVKANRIINYFGLNPRATSMVAMLGALYNLFSKMFVLHKIRHLSQNEIATALKVSPFFVKDYISATKYYPVEKTEEVISLLKEYDLKVKGIGTVETNESELMKELVYKILH